MNPTLGTQYTGTQYTGTNTAISTLSSGLIAAGAALNASGPQVVNGVSGTYAVNADGSQTFVPAGSFNIGGIVISPVMLLLIVGAFFLMKGK